jgi:hypothetical protein
MAPYQVNTTFQEYSWMFNDFERRSKAVDMNDDVLGKYNIVNGTANVTLMTHAMPHRAKSATPLISVELQNYLNRLVVDSPHLGRADSCRDGIDGNGAGRGNDKRPRNNSGNGNGHGSEKPRPDRPESGPKDKTRGKGKPRCITNGNATERHREGAHTEGATTAS